ncbi:MAG TPA: alanine--glyoxylate aminotransferase family protein [Candidatus Dormibacteraeota bacterium]|jgi:aspartate aminotransferase-like enzyme|nr:alanine--glyoxylate aminotransferase family protein [Candidatus Dormibacteraeota bacterium]
MIYQQQLRIPGPTPLPERVVRAASRPMIDHRGPEFAALLAEVCAGVQRVFETANQVLVLTCSGSGGLESAVANLVSPGDEVVACVCGNFGERFAGMAAAYGARVVRLEAEWGQPVDPDDLRRTLAAYPGARLVLLTHNETSTGVTNPLRDLVGVAREAERVVAVDAVSSASSIPVEVDRLGIDVAVSGSQKGWMAPPGLAFVAVGPRAWALAERARAPRYYLDWGRARQEAEKGMTPWTPAIGVLYAVQEGLRMLEEEGLSQVYARHRRLADAVAAGVEALGFRLYAAEGYRSATVTAAVPMPELDVGAYRRLLRERYGVVLGGGQGKMTGKMVRVGHLGAIADGDVVQVLWAMERALEDLDVAPADGRALAAAGPRLVSGSVAVAG